MKQIDRREQERLKTRAAILDATEALMREEGYAAVTSRRVAERAGLKSQLVHYHFKTMDELFQEAFRRNEQTHFARHLNAITAQDPLDAIWKLSVEIEGTDTVLEYVSAANHRKILREELKQTWRRFQTLQHKGISKYFADNEIDPGEYSPEVLSFLMRAIGSMLTNEANLGFNEGHDQIIRFMNSVLASLKDRAQVKRPTFHPGKRKGSAKVTNPDVQ